jgi:hypothetical protein
VELAFRMKLRTLAALSPASIHSKPAGSVSSS